MFPILIETPWFPINSYGFMIMVGFLAAVWVGARRARSIGIKPDLIMDVGIYSMFAGLAGAKVNHILQYPSQYGQSLSKLTDFSHGKLWILGGLAGAVIPWLLMRAQYRKAGTPRRSYAIGFILLYMVCAVVGGFVSNMAIYHWSHLKSWTSGFVFYGGLIPAVIVGILIVRQRGEHVLRVADLAAPCIMLGLALGRVGCFLYGCCYGIVTNLPVGISFPEKSPAYDQHLKDGLIHPGELPLRVHPTQLYETLAAMAIFLILSTRWEKRKRDGEVLAWLGLTYPIWRFFVEFLRGDNERFGGLLTFSQCVSILIFFFSLWWLIRLRRTPVVQAPVVSPAPEK